MMNATTSTIPEEDEAGEMMTAALKNITKQEPLADEEQPTEPLTQFGRLRLWWEEWENRGWKLCFIGSLLSLTFYAAMIGVQDIFHNSYADGTVRIGFIQMCVSHADLIHDGCWDISISVNGTCAVDIDSIGTINLISTCNYYHIAEGLTMTALGCCFFTVILSYFLVKERVQPIGPRICSLLSAVFGFLALGLLILLSVSVLFSQGYIFYQGSYGVSFFFLIVAIFFQAACGFYLSRPVNETAQTAFAYKKQQLSSRKAELSSRKSKEGSVTIRSTKVEPFGTDRKSIIGGREESKMQQDTLRNISTRTQNRNEEQKESVLDSNHDRIMSADLSVPLPGTVSIAENIHSSTSTSDSVGTPPDSCKIGAMAAAAIPLPNERDSFVLSDSILTHHLPDIPEVSSRPPSLVPAPSVTIDESATPIDPALLTPPAIQKPTPNIVRVVSVVRDMDDD